MSIRWPRFLPRLPALLLIPALVPAWASLLWGPESSGQGYERGFPLAFEVYHTDATRSIVPTPYIVRTSPKTFSMGLHYFNYAERSDFRLPHFLFDLMVALFAAYLFAMAVERLVFPLAHRLLGKKPEQGEPR
ncbi:MAG: hypothetical protein O7H41_18315 [Planctomycetota bacterium]|nr:hypothetical protein [Planctomycetota bacterium]